jgi:hypothetical protein
VAVTGRCITSVPSTRTLISGAPLHWSPDARTLIRWTAGSDGVAVTAPGTHSFTNRPPLAPAFETTCALLGRAMFSASSVTPPSGGG